MTPAERIGAVSAAGAIAAVGASIAVSDLLTEYPTVAGQALRYLVGAAVLTVIAWGRVPLPTARELGRLSAVAATGLVGFNLCLIAALRHAEPGAIGVVVGATPLALAVLGPLMEGSRPAPRTLLAAVVVVAGVVVVQGGGESSALGLLLAGGALAGEVCFSLLAVPLLPRLGPRGVSVWAAALAGVGLAVSAALTSGFPAPSASQWLAIGYLAVIVTAVAFLAWYGGVARLGVARAGLFAGLFPVAAVLADAALTRQVSAAAIIGSVLAAAGVALGLVGGARLS